MGQELPYALDMDLKRKKNEKLYVVYPFNIKKREVNEDKGVFRVEVQ